MTARYRKLYPRIWQHQQFQAMSCEARLVALYLLTGPQTNRIGYYRLSVGEALEDLGLAPAQFAKAMSTVTVAMDWGWDAAARVVWIKSWWTWNPPEAPNNLKGGIKDYHDVPASPLSNGFVEALRTVAEPLGVPVPNPSRTPPEPLSNSGTVTGTVTQQEQEPVLSTALTRRLDDGFDAFWSDYPRKAGKGLARKVWEHLRPDDELRARIAAAIRRQRMSPQWLRDGGQYIPHPATWLRQGRWDDELDTAGPRLTAKSVDTLAAGAAFLAEVPR